MKILSILLAEQPATSQMWIRPYKVSWKEDYIDVLLESTSDGTNMSPGAISSVANSILVPSPVAIGQAQIANGFNTERLTITMVVETAVEGGMVRQEILTGYSDYVGMTDNMGRAVYDSEMRFFFNSVSNLNHNVGYGENGYGSYQYNNSTQILTPLRGWDTNDQVPDINRGMTSLRPKDVLANLGQGAMMGMGDGGYHTPVLANTTYSFTQRAKRSSRNNNVSAEYLSRVMTGYRDSMLTGETDSRTALNSLEQASESAYLNEPLTASSTIMQALDKRTSYGQEWSVTWAELLNLDPTIAQRVQPIKMSSAYRDTSAAILSGSAGWNGSNFEQQVAQMATNVLPASMVKFALGELHFIAHNSTANGSADVTIVNLRGIAHGIDPVALAPMIKHHIQHEVYQNLTRNGSFDLYIEARVLLNGMSTITVGINGGDKTPFVSPTYCDAVYSPCLAPNVECLNGLSHDLGSAAARLSAAALSSGVGVIVPQGTPHRQVTYGQANNAMLPLNNQPILMPGNTPGTKNGLGF